MHLSLTNAIVGVQAASFVALSLVFTVHGHWKLAVAQLCYVISTIVLFAQWNPS